MANTPSFKMPTSFAKKSGVGATLPVGDHLVTIESITPTEAKQSENWNDTTPQLAVKFRSDEGTITGWYNMLGYKSFEKDLTQAERKSGKFSSAGDQGYAVDVKTGKRIVSDDNTETARGIFGTLGMHALGGDEGDDFNPEDLIGTEVGIHVAENERGNKRVSYSMPKEKVESFS